MTPTKPRPLSAKHQAFVEQYLTDRNVTRAYMAVYKCSEAGAAASGSKLLKTPKIAAEIAKRTAVIAEKANVSVAYVLDNLTEVVERCMQRAPVMEKVGKDWRQVTDVEGRGVWTFDARGANTALGLIGKQLGMFKDRVEHSADHSLASLLTAARGAQ